MALLDFIMILTQKEILKEISQKRVKIFPFSKKAVGPASIDLTLDSTIRIFTTKEVVEISENTNYEDITIRKKIGKGYILKPGELILGITKEKITLPEDICGWLNSRSRFARIGFMSHITAPFIAPGVSNHQVLEIFNAGPLHIKLIPHRKVCQLILQRCEGKAKYTGKFKNQKL